MPRPRFKKLPLETQGRILHAATEEFAQRGYDSASYNRIIEAAGLSKGAMYYYFDDKLDLYCTVIEGAYAHLLEAVPELLDYPAAKQGFWDWARARLRSALGYALEHPELMAVSRGMSSVSPAERISGRLAELFAAMQAWMAGALAVGQARGVIRQDLPLPLLSGMLAAIGEAIDWWVIEHESELEADLDGVVEVYIDAMRRLTAPSEE